ncbi:hypothetical protein J6590_040146 [Homalodisca vitripennis]|nr:hypothetical protein J6590_040146 [Homalodisca vitripennis]
MYWADDLSVAKNNEIIKHVIVESYQFAAPGFYKGIFKVVELGYALTGFDDISTFEIEIKLSK